VELKPNFPYALYNLGTALLEQGKFRDAVGPLEKTAALQPTRWEPQQRLAETYAALGNLKRSRAAAERARDLRSRRSARN
jgi:Flp pilus assembly protein TadD